MKASAFARWKDDEFAAADFRTMLAGLLGTILAVVVSVVTLNILADLAPSYFSSLADLITALSGATTNNTTADLFLSSIVVVVAIVLAMGFIFLVFRSATVGTRLGSKF